MSKNDHLYPKEGEPWTGITEKILKEKGFIKAIDISTNKVTFFHNSAPYLYIRPSELCTIYFIYLAQAGVNSKGEDVLKEHYLREVKYMYQIDNMFHGFTDRWLGYI